MRFTKMHGIGNDYVYVNCVDQAVDDPRGLAIKVSDRHFGIGSDGLILVCPSSLADVRMRMFNADGSESQMCGNGLRCVAKYSYENNLAKGREVSNPVLREFTAQAAGAFESIRALNIETGRGILTVALAINAKKVSLVGLDMGEPILRPDLIPVKVVGQQAVGVPVTVASHNLLMTCVSMGNPHAVFFCDDVAKIELERIGPLLENHALFPQRVNVHFVQVVSSNEVIMRTWERGSGITLACGTGAAAVCVAGVLASKTGRAILAHLPGGDLKIVWDQKDNHVYLAGPATEVFSGDWPS